MSEYDELVNKLLSGKVGFLTCDDAATAIKKLQARVNMYSAAADKSAVEALKLSAEVERLKGVLEFVDLNISKDNDAAKEAIRSALEAKP
jgi:uncharacterized protein with PhoU and TrkA domain